MFVSGSTKLSREELELLLITAGGNLGIIVQEAVTPAGKIDDSYEPSSYA